ncbi:MAG: hypothetical protein KDA65_11355, partial [Planctomycetaceae bacterium]|nr:hypothetical protein [Planctomycetaceae bacterium]
YFEPDGDDHALCLYDPLKDRYIIKRTSPRNVLSVRTTDEKLALLTPLEEPDVQEANRLLLEIIDPESERHLLRYEIKDDQANKLSFLRVFDDRDHYYVNLQHHDNSPDLPRQYYPAGDTLLENVTIRGKMLAFDKQTGKLLWKKTFQPASVIRLEPYRLPVLILVSRTRDRMNPNLHSLAVEAIDTRTGKSLGFHDEILTDRLVYGTYDPHKQRVSLTGHRTTIHLDLLSEETKALYLQATGSFQGLDLR